MKYFITKDAKIFHKEHKAVLMILIYPLEGHKDFPAESESDENCYILPLHFGAFA